MMMRITHPPRTQAHTFLTSLRGSSTFPFLTFSPRTLQINKLPSPRNSPRKTLSMSSTVGVSPNSKTPPSPRSNEDDVAKFGFQRATMYESTLSNTVDAYGRHVFLCFKGPDRWAPRVEDFGEDPLPRLLSGAIKARKNDLSLKTKFTICGGGDETDGDVLVFPDMIKYRGLKDSDVDSFVEDVLVNGKPWSSGAQEKLDGTYVFVCSHGSHDKRCGVCGPPLMDKLKEEIGLRNMTERWFVGPCSHIGGHKYAGNLIIYGPDMEGKITGHWYGYVTPDDVPRILDDHIGMGQIIERLWRGQMGGRVDGGGEKKLPNDNNLRSQKESQESNNLAEKGTATGCCQGDNGASCCMDGNGVAKL